MVFQRICSLNMGQTSDHGLPRTISVVARILQTIEGRKQIFVYSNSR